MTTGEERKDFHELYGDDPFEMMSGASFRRWGVCAPELLTSQMEKDAEILRRTSCFRQTVLLGRSPRGGSIGHGDIGKVDLDGFRRLS
jgi:hypothetical protein